MQVRLQGFRFYALIDNPEHQYAEMIDSRFTKMFADSIMPIDSIYEIQTKTLMAAVLKINSLQGNSPHYLKTIIEIIDMDDNSLETKKLVVDFINKKLQTSIQLRAMKKQE